MSNNATAIATFPTASILGLIFIALKLTGHIAWSWWWVLAPFWAPVAIGLTVLAVYLVMLLIIALMTLFYQRK